MKALYPFGISSKFGKIELSVLDYRLQRGQENEQTYLETTINKFTTARTRNTRSQIVKAKYAENKLALSIDGCPNSLW